MRPPRLCHAARHGTEQGVRGGLVGWPCSRVEDGLYRAPTTGGDVRTKVWRLSDSVVPQGGGGGGGRCNEGKWVGGWWVGGWHFCRAGPPCGGWRVTVAEGGLVFFKMENPGFDPGTSRMLNGRSAN